MYITICDMHFYIIKTDNEYLYKLEKCDILNIEVWIMTTILESIFKDNKKDRVSVLNNSFFKEYLDSDLIIKLIDIRKLYLDILTFEKSKEADIHTRDKLKIKLDDVLDKKNKLENQNFSFLKKKISIVKALTESIDVKKIEVEEKINESLINNTNLINELNIEAEKISNEINSLTINKYDKDMLVNALKYKINNIPSISVNYLSADKKDIYDKQLNSIIINEDARKCYITYLFEMINSDIDNLCHTYNISKNYMLISYQKDVNINLENNSIVLENIISKKLNEKLSNYIEIITDKNLTNNTISEISSEKLKHNSIIHTMSHFAKNYKELKSDEEVISREYEMIRGFVVDLMRDTKNNSDKLMVDIINDTIDIFKSFSENIGLY